MSSKVFFNLTIISLVVNTCLGVTYLESPISGKSTYYGGNPSGGACGYATVETATFPFGYYSACGGSVFDDGYGCGKCYEITCIGPYDPNPSCSCSSSTPSVIISCMDLCPECGSSHFDLDAAAFARIVGAGLAGTCGVIETTVRRVSCEYLTNIKIRAKSGTSQYWYGFHLDNIAGYGAVSAAEVKSFGSSSYDTTCDKSGGASYWLCAGGFPLAAPLSLKLTNDNNQVLVFDDCITNFDGGAEFDCGSNFGGGATPTAPTPTAITLMPTTKSPTSITAAPVSQPTTSPISGPSCGLLAKFTLQTGSSLWWLAFFIDDLCCGTVTKVEVKDGSNYVSYVVGVDSTYNYWQFDNADYGGLSFSAPLTVRVTNTNNEVIEFIDVLQSVDPPNIFYGDTNFCVKYLFVHLQYLCYIFNKLMN